MRAELVYALDDALSFTEIIEFVGMAYPSDPQVRDAFERCLWLLHLVAGTSYYKAAVPNTLEIETGPLPPDVAAMLTTLYRNGLAEFAWKNQLPHVANLTFPADSEPTPPASETGLPRRTLVPIGGGKDSIVTVELLRRADVPLTLFSVGTAQPIVATAEQANIPLVSVKRSLSPLLLDINATGAYNGHVPVTAITSVLACATALLTGCNTVAMSNEHSASAGSFVWEGLEVNHQYSKGFEFEKLLADVVRTHIARDLTYFSFLRPLSELAIARLFAGMTNYHDLFMSCNRPYRLSARDHTPTWCGTCHKCRFVFLVLAPYMTPDHLTKIFGSNLLDDMTQADGYRELLTVGATKPLDCVGEEVESQAALRALLAEPAWQSCAVVHALGPLVTSMPGSDAALTKAMEYGSGQLPDTYEVILREAL